MLQAPMHMEKCYFFKAGHEEGALQGGCSKPRRDPSVLGSPWGKEEVLVVWRVIPNQEGSQHSKRSQPWQAESGTELGDTLHGTRCSNHCPAAGSECQGSSLLPAPKKKN